MKIAYCTDSICYAGGIQRVTIAKANKLALKNEVWIIVTDNKDKPVFPLSTKVHLVNCDINYFEDDWKSRFYILKGIIYKRKQHKKRLKEILNQIQPDIVITVGMNFFDKVAQQLDGFFFYQRLFFGREQVCFGGKVITIFFVIFLNIMQYIYHSVTAFFHFHLDALNDTYKIAGSESFIYLANNCLYIFFGRRK